MQRAADLAAAAPDAQGRSGFPGRVARRITHATSSLSLLSRVVAGSALLALLVAGAFAVMLLAMSDLRRSTNQQAQSKSVTAATLGLERVVNDLEVSLRSYVATGNEHFLASWHLGRTELQPSIAHLENLIAGQEVQSRQARQLSALIHSYILEYGLPLIIIARVSPDAARGTDATNEGLIRIKGIRHQLSRLLNSEDALASENAASAKHGAVQAVRIGISALVATAGLLMLFGIFLARGIARPVRTVADGASQVASGDLSTRLPEGGAAEIHTLTSSFNAMARSLDHGKRELQKQNEELRQNQRLMSQLVSIVSHELRTPLASILGYTRVLLDRDVEKADARHYLEIIEEQGRRLSSLVDEFLEGEGVESGRLELKEELLDLKAVLVEEAALVRGEASKHRIEVAVEEGSLPVRGDRDRLAQVIVNLLTNAVKYSPEGGLVEVLATFDGDAVRVQVRDEGIGVPDEHQTRIFTKFFRGDARESGIAGAGLGLAVSREIVEAHGGRIGFTSRTGAGSAFWFELPRAD